MVAGEFGEVEFADRVGISWKQCGVWGFACVYKSLYGASITGRVDVRRHVCGIRRVGVGAAGGAFSVRLLHHFDNAEEMVSERRGAMTCITCKRTVKCKGDWSPLVQWMQ